MIKDYEQWTYIKIPQSEFSFTSQGGPLLISVDLSLVLDRTPQTFGCRPMVDGAWAGSYGGYPYSPNWSEGLMGTNYAWAMWTKTRVYTGIPAGTHTLYVECLKDQFEELKFGHEIVPQSIDVLELHE